MTPSTCARCAAAMVQRVDAAVEHDLRSRMRGLEPIDASVVERRHFAVLPRREALEPGLAGMHDERVDAGRAYRAGQSARALARSPARRCRCGT